MLESCSLALSTLLATAWPTTARLLHSLFVDWIERWTFHKKKQWHPSTGPGVQVVQYNDYTCLTALKCWWMCKQCRNACRGTGRNTELIIKCQKQITAKALMDKKDITQKKWGNAKLQRKDELVVLLNNGRRMMAKFESKVKWDFFFFTSNRCLIKQEIWRGSSAAKDGAKTWNTGLKPTWHRNWGTLSLRWTCWTSCPLSIWSKCHCQRAIARRQRMYF